MVKFAHCQSRLRTDITKAYRQDEEAAVNYLLGAIKLTGAEKTAIAARAAALIKIIRSKRQKAGGVDALMQEFSLSDEEGIALMCLAESFLRIPDTATQALLIQDKLSPADWRQHLNQSDSLFVNAAAWGLLLTGKLTRTYEENNLKATLWRLLGKGSGPLIRTAVKTGMGILGNQFVMGETITQALTRAKKREVLGYRYSFDMLGEAALTADDAERYYQDYVTALNAIGRAAGGAGVYAANGLSVKLSALHPRYERAQYQRLINELFPKLKTLFLLAKKYDIGLNIDAEEAGRLELSLDLIEKLALDPDLAGFKGIGIVVQAYQKRCPYVIAYLVDLAQKSKQRFMVRLVKGAYWDSEIKLAQVEGLSGFPVYTRKAYTDVSYLLCAQKLLQHQAEIFPQFATHNVYTAAAVYEFGKNLDYEFQCLHGMGETLYDQIAGDGNWGRQVRVYAPVGTHETLLAYLVRRLLENGANTSFVNQLLDPNVASAALTACPIDLAESYKGQSHPFLQLPATLFPGRQNSKGLDFTDELALQQLENGINPLLTRQFTVHSLLAPQLKTLNEEPPRRLINPADGSDILGEIFYLQDSMTDELVAAGEKAGKKWGETAVSGRAEIICRFAELLESKRDFFIMLALREAGKTYANAVGEIREAVDFCRYYAAEALKATATTTAEGVYLTISPWNFPLSIFIGETVAALLAGYAVVAKAAEQTTISAYYAVRLLHKAGVPPAVLQLAVGDGKIGAALAAHPSIAGITFTGSAAVAHSLNRNLAVRSDLPVLIAETGGQNAMIADSSALTEQVVSDVIRSAFDCAGQRCSALRILCLQEETAERTLKMLRGAMAELTIGNPAELATDIGPVIDKEAAERLQKHIALLRNKAKYFYTLSVPAALNGHFIPPVLAELDDLSLLTTEVFGPVLHVIRYRAADLEKTIAAINAKGYALTHGIHSRINRRVDMISRLINAGNIYVNRNIIGAAVGSQPFGGFGLSGTGPKAGGPFYLPRVAGKSRYPLPPVSTPGSIDPGLYQKITAAVQKSDLEKEAAKTVLTALNSARNLALTQARYELAGPTGENNYLTFRPLPDLFLWGNNPVKLLSLWVCAALYGIKTEITAANPLAAYPLLRTFNLTVLAKDTDSSAAVIMATEPPPAALKSAWAQTAGAVRKIILMPAADSAAFFHEIAVSINTTAAGGNAGLMALADHES